ncbi:MAG: anthranilate synthase component I family protein [Bacteroidia bacterium]
MFFDLPYILIVEHEDLDRYAQERSVVLAGRKATVSEEPFWRAGGWSYEWQGVLPYVKESIISFPKQFFFRPQWVWENLTLSPARLQTPLGLRFLYSSFTRDSFIRTVETIQNHIYHGEVYQLNLTCEFLWEGTIAPLEVYFRLREASPMPFNFFFRWQNKYVIGASPERFLWYHDGYLMQQPIKGTRPRGLTSKEDQQLHQELANDPKELAENTMIVDLVRNEFYQFCEPESVEVVEWAQVHTFRGLHHLVSTIRGRPRPGMSLEQAVKYVFPPGSMTGAPKAAAMNLIDRYEPTGRGIYSGSIGYVRPDGSFDFWVVIRSLVYDAKKKLLSFHVGSGITSDSDPEKEWQETLLKAERLCQALDITLPGSH